MGNPKLYPHHLHVQYPKGYHHQSFNLLHSITMIHPEFTITELLIIHQALKDDKVINTYAHGYMNSSRESAIMKSRKAIDEMDDYIKEAKEMRALIKRKLMGEKDEE